MLTYHLINAPVDGGVMRGARGRVVSVEGADLHVNGVGEGPVSNELSGLGAEVYLKPLWLEDLVTITHGLVKVAQ